MSLKSYRPQKTRFDPFLMTSSTLRSLIRTKTSHVEQKASKIRKWDIR